VSERLEGEEGFFTLPIWAMFSQAGYEITEAHGRITATLKPKPERKRGKQP